MNTLTGMELRERHFMRLAWDYRALGISFRRWDGTPRVSDPAGQLVGWSLGVWLWFFVFTYNHWQARDENDWERNHPEERYQRQAQWTKENQSA